MGIWTRQHTKGNFAPGGIFRGDIFFCLKTNWQRVGVKRQKKISFCVENSALKKMGLTQ